MDTSVVTFNKEHAPEALFEEHRFPMLLYVPKVKKQNFGVSLHTLSLLTPYTNIPYQWWSLGTSSKNNTTELELYPGPIAMNGKINIAKVLQERTLPYGDTWANVKPKAVI